MKLIVRLLPLLISLPFSLVAQDSGHVTLNDSLVLKPSLIYSEAFNDLNAWKTEQQPGGTVVLNGGRMEIEDKAGCTVWFEQPLQQPVMIEFTATVIDEGGPQDRVSDLNCFWLASDPWRGDFFGDAHPHRAGKFSQYDSLQLYYVGLGGHNNTKTRFRRYAGNGQKPLLPEHDLSDEAYLIVPNVPNRIRIIVYTTTIQYWRNEQLIFNVYDASPYDSGYFAFRTVNNHLFIDDFNVYDLSKMDVP
ncbi:hypothetical protein SAMN05192553_11629 [Cyclobacterium xiamenense]|uniref:DUF6250 domain-containing protein n=1 Tax=Cyclobacterium xiamenense TaxID=1297121 RepID=A0A1H7BVK0_9BACT|nr:DUF6250 domain-containing protein [Cyclobacterium xiamenense]SEJ81246.1 hypothetical protein SAMN05192553_11629 [Cyclobacterium xiamenense]